MAHGLLLIRKDAGPTSNGVLGKLKARLGTRDIGHGGTLDSFATGLLPVFVGEGLKLSRFFLENHPTLPTYWKSYRAVMKLGVATAALDPVSEVVATAPVPALTEALVEEAIAGYRGRFEQIPPDYSAKKIDGKRASDRVRDGETVALKSVSVEVRALEIHRQTADEIEFSVTCSKGTYVRALARDIAARLGTIAHLTRLERTAVGPFLASDAIGVDEAALDGGAGFVALDALCKQVLPAVTVSYDAAAHLFAGRSTAVLSAMKDLAPSAYYACRSDGTPVALLEVPRAGALPLLLRCFRASSDLP